MTQVVVETAAPTVVEVTVGGFGLTTGVQYPGGLSPPGNLQATDVTEDSLILTWTPSYDTSGVEAVGYNVYESVAGVDELLASVIAPPYPITGLDAGTTHTYRVTPLTAAGDEGAAATIGVTTVATVTDTTPPTDPTSLVAVQTTNGATLTWADSTDASGIGGYNVYLVVAGSDVLQAFISETTYKITGLDSGVAYTAKVEAVDVVGLVSAKVSVGFTTDTPGDTTAPTVPTGFQSTAHSTSTIALAWGASTDTESGLDYYEITSGFTVVATPTGLSTTLTGLNPSTAYTLNIRAVDKAGNRSAFAGVLHITTDSTETGTDTTPPSVPQNFRFGKVTQTSIQLLWDASTDTESGVAGYDVVQSFAVIAQPATNSYTVPNLKPGTSYSFNVKAFDVVGNRSAFAGAIATSTTGTPTVTAWPPQDFTGGFGTTLNNRPYKDKNGNPTTEAYRWKNAADALIAAMVSHPDEWNVARIQVDMGSLEPAANGVYKPSNGDVQDKVDWCVAHGIRPILDLVGPHVNYTVKLKYSNCTISPSGGFARITCPDFDGGFNYQNLSVHGAGLPEGQQNYVPLGGQGSGYVDTLVPWTTTVTGKTITFGGGGPGGASSDDHLWVAKGTGLANFVDEGTVDHRIDVAKAAAFVAAHFAYANPIIEYWNEANGDHGRRPSGNPVDRYIDELMYVYRAVKEYDAGTPVLFTGVNNNTSTSESARSLDGPKYLRLAWARMRTNTKWNDGAGGGWVNATTKLLTTSNTPTGFPGVGRTTLGGPSGLLAAGTVSPRYWVDYAGWHAYSITRGGSSAGADNYSYWSDRDVDEDGGGGINPDTGKPYNHFGTGARFVRMLNDIHTESLAADGDPNIDNIRFMCTETFPPWHPLATTGVGGLVADGFDPGGGTSNTYCASPEEAGIQIFMLKCYVKGKRNWATGGSIPAYTGPGDPAARWAAINGQWITETPQTYAAAGNFFFQGFWTNVAIGSVPADRLKQAIGADATARQNLKDGKTHDGDSHFFSNTHFPAAVVDAVTAFDHRAV